MYETTPWETVREITQDLGVERGALRQWLAQYETGDDGSPVPNPAATTRGRRLLGGRLQTQVTPSETITCLKVVGAKLRAQVVKPCPGAGDPFSRRSGMFRRSRRSSRTCAPVR